MIGDRGYPGDEDQPLAEWEEEWGPLDAATRLSPPVRHPDLILGAGASPPVWVERYRCLVLIRHTFPDGRDATTETHHPSEASAVRGMASAIGFLLGRGYMLVPGDDRPPGL